MMFRKISFALLLALPFAASADDYTVWNQYYNSYSTALQTSVSQLDGVQFDQALNQALYRVNIYVSTNINASGKWTVHNQADHIPIISNKTTGVVYNPNSLASFLTVKRDLINAITFANSLGSDLDTLKKYIWPNWTVSKYSSTITYLYPHYLNPYEALEYFKNKLSVSQLEVFEIMCRNVNSITSDVSALVPLVESNKNINAGIALDFKSATTNAQYQRSEIINDLTTIIQNRLLNQTVDYDIPQIKDDIRALVSVDPSVAFSDNNALALEYFDLLGFDYSTDQAALVQAMINAGLATDNNDALGKLSSTTWRRNTLGPYVQAQRKKRNLIAELRQSGIDTNFDGRALDALANAELETLLQYSYNTPASSNATLQAHALDSLKSIDNNMVDAAGDVRSISQRLEGPLNVNVLNWPDDWLGNSVSNALDGVFSGFLDGLTNFNPHYSFDDNQFFSRNLYSWRGFGQSTLDQSEQNPVERDSAIGVTSFEFSPTGDFFQDVPNLLAMQSMQGADLANIFATVAIHVQSNAQEMANTDALVDQYQEDLATAAAEALDDFQSMMHYSNLLSNVQFTDTQDLLELPDGFRVFSGDWQVPEYVNIELPTWDFHQPGTDGNNPPNRDQVNPGHTITIDTTQYRSFFQNVRYASLVLYWGLLICFVLVLFRVFRAFIGIIPKTLTGNADSSYTA